ncbi:hypothetical protein ACWGJ9_09835 [Curtobacterium citreum]
MQQLLTLFRQPNARRLMVRMMITRLGTAAFSAGLAAVVAVVTKLQVIPGSGWALSGIAALGVVSVASGVGGILANSVGQRLIETRGVRGPLLGAGALQMLVAAATVWVVVVGGPAAVTVAGIAVIGFLDAAASPGISGLARAWWRELDLTDDEATKGGALEPTLSAVAWSLGPAIGAPLALLSPWFLPAFAAVAAVGMMSLSSFPNPYRPVKQANAVEGSGSVRRSTLAEWWLAGSYAFYHVARSLLGMGSTAVLVSAGQPGLTGAASAAPSLGHVVAGVAYAARAKGHGHLRAVMSGLLGQAVPTLAIAVVLFIWPHPGAVVAAVVVVGGNLVAGVLKAPVAAAVYPLAAANRPGTHLGRSSARMAQAITVGGLIGPLVGTAIVATAGAQWLLPASVLALLVCAAGTLLDRRITSA